MFLSYKSFYLKLSSLIFDLPSNSKSINLSKDQSREYYNPSTVFKKYNMKNKSNLNEKVAIRRIEKEPSYYIVGNKEENKNDYIVKKKSYMFKSIINTVVVINISMA